MLKILIVDDDVRAKCNERTLDIERHRAVALGRETLAVLVRGDYVAPSGRTVTIRGLVGDAVARKVSLPPGAALPARPAPVGMRLISVENDTTLSVARRLAADGRTLALNFAASTHPGGGFLNGARAQEENLTRSSGLYSTLEGDPFYDHHRHLGDAAASDWTILSPDVPVFREDDGTFLEQPWLCTILTCAAPVASRLPGRDLTPLLRGRIERILAVSAGSGCRALVLGAWGCGAFKNDGRTVATLFRDALAGPYRDAFETVAFAITDWSPERRFLGPFRDAFGAGQGGLGPSAAAILTK